MGNSNSQLNSAGDSGPVKLLDDLIAKVIVPVKDPPVQKAHVNSDKDIFAKSTNLPFENLVLEGGGAKGVAYCGALRVLEKVGLLDKNGNHKIKRFAGTSAGAITACLLATGHSVDEVQIISEPAKIKALCIGSGSLGLILIRFDNIYRFFRHYGFVTSKPIRDELGFNIEKKTKDANITFQQLYEMNGKELCVVVTNLSTLSVEYFHPKTTPDVKIRDAVRMSMTIPGYFSAIKDVISAGKDEDVFVDGGVLCNYPIHCFDGWYLSMKEEDSFMKRVQPLEDLARLYDQSERFGSYNEKTLGLMLYADSDREWMKHYFDKRPGTLEPERPTKETQLSKLKAENRKQESSAGIVYQKTLDALVHFRKITDEYNIIDKSVIDKQEFHKIFNDVRFTHESRRILFQDCTEEEAFKKLDKNGNDEISYTELIQFTEGLGVCLQNKYIGFTRGSITNLPTFFKSLVSALIANSKLVYIQSRDRERTVGINTGHVTTMDFDLEGEDVDFIIKRGENAATAFLREYATQSRKKR